MLAMRASPALPARATARCGAARRPVRCLVPVVKASAEQQEQQASLVSKLALPLAAAVTAATLASAVAAPEALAARSGGRAGASSFSARRSYSAPRAQAPVRNYSSTTIVTAPPVYASPFGFSPFGGFGFGFGVPVFGFPMFGGLLQFMFLMLIVNVVFNVVRSALSGGSKSSSKGQDWDDL